MIPIEMAQLGRMAAVCWLFAAGASAQAADASPWQGGAQATVRLIAGAPLASPEGRVLRAGLEVKLASAWKTYWRYPGDAGVPPRFIFTRSDNLRSATVLWPAPVAFESGGSYSIGYTQRVIFPLRVVPKDPAKPVRLRLDFDYAVCEKICVPIEAKLELVLDGAATAHEADLRQSESRVARKSVIGAPGPLAVRAVRREPGVPGTVRVDLIAAPGAEVELFAEGPTPEWALPIPAAGPTAPDGSRTFTFTLDGVPPDATAKGALLRLTAVAGDQAIEVEARLD